MAEPWRGDLWGDSENIIGGARLMILGESHHSAEHAVGSYVPNMTQDVVQAYLEGKLGKTGKFFANVERLVTGSRDKPLTREQSDAFWRSVVFYNYIPVVAASKPNSRPLPEMWEGDTPRIFFDAVKRSEAEIILVCGRDLWRRKKHHVTIPAAYNIAGRSFEAHEINWSDNYGAVAAHILHPSGSRGWTFDANVPVVNYLFDELGRRRQVRGEPTLPDWKSALRL
ncbi:hypothetical protein M0654_03860 [Rhizobium sp. NTR19]|uniref:Uracil-DNA glycosylase-like domain-containing protein n=1 Tax=Neorhizobium turbinariae TaxID=2937795 RepID=A0ABT0IMK5_9HYPH|nr:hypothetical protein [Neorhizobium turbinariae]MCK8779115.1 hypothetical protein [Neorhizobium turbinariae]